MFTKNFYELCELPTIGLRYFRVFGKRQGPNSTYATVIPKFIRALLKMKQQQYMEMDYNQEIFILHILLPSPLRGFFLKIVEELGTIVTQTELVSSSMGTCINLVRNGGNGISLLYFTAGFGVGAGNAEYYMANFSQYYTTGIITPHNWWLEILIDYGIFVFIGYIIFYIEIIRNLWKIYRKKQTREEKIICEALLVSLVGFFFASISSSSIMAFKPQWLLFAFALSFLNYSRNIKEMLV